MSATKLTTKAVLTTPATDDIAMVVDVSDTTGSAEGTSKQITLANLKSAVSAVTSVNGAVGVVSIGVQDLDDVAGGTPSTGDVISYTAGTWVLNSGLQTLLARFKASGTGAQVFDTLNDTSKGYVDVQATSAKIGLAETTIDISQTSPGAMTFGVAAGGTGVETQYNAAFLNGQTTAGTAHLLLKSGTEFRLENAGGYETWLRQNPSAAANITVGLPATGGTLALTTDIPSVPVDSVNGQTGVVVLDTDDIAEGATNEYFTDARVAANSAVAANTAKVGITTQQAADITANNAKIATVVDDTSPQLGGNLDVNGFDIESNGDVIVQIDADNNTPLAKFAIKNGAGTTIYTIDEEGTTLATTGASNDVKIGNLDGSLGTFNGISLNGNLTYPGIVGFAGGSSVDDNFYCFGEVLDFRAGGVSDASMRIVEDSTDGTQVTINHVFPVPTTHNLAVNGTGLFAGNVDFSQGIDVTGNITVTGTVDGVDIAAAHAAYEETELVTGQNILMITSIGVASNKIVDIMGDALADTSNANSKKLIGFHTGNGDCVLQGMVDAVSPINGATAGGPLWLGASGVFSSAAPTTANYYSRVVGYFVGTGQGGEIICYFDPSKDWVQIS